MFYVGLGGIFGAITRFLLGKWISSKASSTFPFGTWIINITGSLLLGFLFVLRLGNGLSEDLWLLVGTGFIGAYTTFSTFGYETIQMIQKKEHKNVFLYVSVSVVLGIVFAWIGGLIGSIM